MGSSSNVAVTVDRQVVFDAVAVDRQVVGTDQKDYSAGEPFAPFGLMEEGQHYLKKKMDPRLRMDLGLVFHIRAAERLYMQHRHINCLEGANPFHQPIAAH